jgi:hypothetical protein
MALAREQHARKLTRSDKGNVVVTGRDWFVLQWIGEQYAARLDHVQSLLGHEAGKGVKVAGQISRNAARQVVGRWKRAGLADAKKILADEPAWVWLTARGLHELGLAFKPYTPSLARLEHLHRVNQVRMALEEQRPDDVWFSEREFRADMVYEKGVILPHIPDGILETQRGDIAIEVELTVKKPADLEAILRELARDYVQVWYFATTETRDAVRAARKRIGASCEERVLIHSLV